MQFELVSFHPLPTSNRAAIPSHLQNGPRDMVLQQAYDRVRDLPTANLNRAQILPSAAPTPGELGRKPNFSRR